MSEWTRWFHFFWNLESDLISRIGESFWIIVINFIAGKNHSSICFPTLIEWLLWLCYRRNTLNNDDRSCFGLFDNWTDITSRSCEYPSSLMLNERCCTIWFCFRSVISINFGCFTEKKICCFLIKHVHFISQCLRI